MTTDEILALKSEVEALKRENAKLKDDKATAEALKQFYLEEYLKRVAAPEGQGQQSSRSDDTEELEKRYAPFFDANSPKFNITEASKFMRDNPSVGKALLERFEGTWSTGKFATESRTRN